MDMASRRPRYAILSLAMLALPGQPCLAQPQVWRLSPEPLLVLGADDNPQTEFHQIKGVLRLDNGALAVANGGTNEIRIFSANGELLRTIGRAGSGPGEFRSITWFGRTADTLFVADHITARITSFLTDGTRLATTPILARDPSRRFTVGGRLPDGRWLVWTSASPTIYGPQRVFRDTAHIGLMAPSAAGHIRWLGSFPGLTFFLYNPTNGEHGLSVGVLPFGARLVVTVLAGKILVADTDRPVITAVAEGGLSQDFPLPLRPSPLTDREITLHRDEAMTRAGGGAMKGYFEALYSQAVLPRTKPLHGGMITSTDQQLWLLPYATIDQSDSSYLVLNSHGQPIATVPSPPGFQLREAGPDYVLGVHVDEDGVERVHSYRLANRL